MERLVALFLILDPRFAISIIALEVLFGNMRPGMTETYPKQKAPTNRLFN